MIDRILDIIAAILDKLISVIGFSCIFILPFFAEKIVNLF
jgi:hypothetical protein